MSVEEINNIQNVDHIIPKIVTTSLSGKGFFGSRFKTVAPILSLVILVLAAAIFYLFRPRPKKPTDNPKEKFTAKPENKKNQTPPEKPLIPPNKVPGLPEETTITTEEHTYTQLNEEPTEPQKESTEPQQQTDKTTMGLNPLILPPPSNPTDSPTNNLPPYPIEIPPFVPNDLFPRDLPPPCPLLQDLLPPNDLPPPLPPQQNSSPPTDLPPPLPPERKPLPEPPKKVTPTTQPTPAEIRALLFKNTQAAYLNGKNFYKIIQNKESIGKKAKKLAVSTTSLLKKSFPKEGNKKNKPTNPGQALLSKFKTENANLKAFLEKLKTVEVNSIDNENIHALTLTGIIKRIQLNIEDLEKTDLLNKLSLSRKAQYDILKENLKITSLSDPKKIIESTLTTWNEKADVRASFFDELESAENRFAADLKSYLEEAKKSIEEKFQKKDDLCIQYTLIHTTSLKLANEFTSIKKEESDAKKMAKVALIFHSKDFQKYVLAIQNYFAFASNQDLLKSGIDLRALTLPTTRLPLYPLLIETAITLTPKKTPESHQLAAALTSLRQQLEFLQ